MVVDSEAVRKATKEFDTKLSGLVNQLSTLSSDSFDDTASKSRDNTQSVLYLKVVGLLEQFTPPRLPSQVYFQRLVQSGEDLVAAKQYDLACNDCFLRFIATPETHRGLPKESESDRLAAFALDFRAKMGIITCRSFIATEQDPELRKPSTAEDVLCQLEALRDLVEVRYVSIEFLTDHF
jgi:hypothetical protein